MSRLTDDQVRTIRDRYYSGEPAYKIARDLGVRSARIRDCVHGRTYRRVVPDGFHDAHELRAEYWKTLHDVDCDYSYGMPLSPNPLLFSPDSGASHWGSVTRWIRDVLDGVDQSSVCHSSVEYDDTGKLRWHISHPRWGYGITIIPDGEES